jgi:hypothetical protein
MLAKIISAGALTLLLSSGALAYIPQHNVYAGHSNGQQSAQMGQQYAANSAPFGYNDTQGSHAMGGGPG